MTVVRLKKVAPPEEVAGLRPTLSSDEVCPFPRPGTDFSGWEKLTLSDGGDLLRILRVLSRKFSWSSLADSVLDPGTSDMRAEIEFYKKTRFEKKPGTFFRRPKELPQVCLSEPFALSEGEVVDLLFQTNFQPRYKPFQDEFVACRTNQKVHARMWRHPPGKSLGRIIAIHGWFMGDHRMSALTLVPGFFYRLGLDVILYELPYHGRRMPITDGGKQSLFPSAHVARTNEGFAQAIYELRTLAAWLDAEEKKPIGAIGMSLGGYTAALWASLDPLAFVIPVVPLVSIADLVWDVFCKRPVDADPAKTQELFGFSRDELHALYAVHCSLSYKPKVPLNRRLILAGIGDPIIPRTQPEMLWEHWEKPRIHWFEGGHLGQIAEANALLQVHQFLLSLKLAHPELLPINGG